MPEKKSEEGYLEERGDEFTGLFHVLLSESVPGDSLFELLSFFSDTNKRVRITIEELED